MSCNLNDTRSLLRAVRHLQRYPATDTRRGRPSRWRREDLLTVLFSLTDILDRETSSRVSVATFIDHYIGILEFPPDIRHALEEERINLFEAEQLVRINCRSLSIGESAALKVRMELLATHLKAKLSGERLRLRVNELLGRVPASDGPAKALVPVSADHVDTDAEIDEYDASHLFWDEIQRLSFAFQSLQKGDVSESEIEEFLNVCEPVWTVLNKIQRRRERRPPAAPFAV